MGQADCFCYWADQSFFGISSPPSNFLCMPQFLQSALCPLPCALGARRLVVLLLPRRNIAGWILGGACFCFVAVVHYTPCTIHHASTPGFDFSCQGGCLSNPHAVAHRHDQHRLSGGHSMSLERQPLDRFGLCHSSTLVPLLRLGLIRP